MGILFKIRLNASDFHAVYYGMQVKNPGKVMNYYEYKNEMLKNFHA